MADARRLNELGVPTVLSKELKDQIEGAGSTAASGITVAAGDDGLDAGSVQDALQALATRIAALE